MYTIIIIALLTIFLAIRHEKLHGYYSDIIDYVFLIISNLFWTIPIAFVIAFCLPTNTYIEKYEWEIESLQDGNSINGNFFLGSGYIKEKMVYSLYLKEQEGYKMYQLDSKQTHIKYSEGTPTLIIIEEKPNDDLINYFSLNISENKYVIKVPKGTILNNYTLDAK